MTYLMLFVEKMDKQPGWLKATIPDFFSFLFLFFRCGDCTYVFIASLSYLGLCLIRNTVESRNNGSKGNGNPPMMEAVFQSLEKIFL